MTTLAELIAVCKGSNRATRLKSITKEAMADVLGNSSLDDQQMMQETVHTMATEMVEIRRTNAQILAAFDRIDKLEERMTKIEKENRELRDTVAKQENKQSTEQFGQVLKQHQTFLERWDAKERAPNLIVFGIEEEQDGDADTDTDEVLSTIQSIDGGIQRQNLISVKRLGNKDDDKTRPILAVMESGELRNRIANAARDKGRGQRGGVQVKKDIHPSVRAEWRRLFEAKETEEKKPENAGCQISLNMKKRQLLRDGQVIDSWCSQLF